MSAGSRRRRERPKFSGRTPGTQCLGKLRYGTNAAANKAIAELTGYARAYKCPVCNHLHITSKERGG